MYTHRHLQLINDEPSAGSQLPFTSFHNKIYLTSPRQRRLRHLRTVQELRILRPASSRESRSNGRSSDSSHRVQSFVAAVTHARWNVQVLLWQWHHVLRTFATEHVATLPATQHAGAAGRTSNHTLAKPDTARP